MNNSDIPLPQARRKQSYDVSRTVRLFYKTTATSLYHSYDLLTGLLKPQLSQS